MLINAPAGFLGASGSVAVGRLMLPLLPAQITLEAVFGSLSGSRLDE